MINYLPRITFIYDRYHKSSKSKQATVEMRITYNKKQKYISTGIQLYPNQWDGKKTAFRWKTFIPPKSRCHFSLFAVAERLGVTVHSAQEVVDTEVGHHDAQESEGDVNVVG